MAFTGFSSGVPGTTSAAAAAAAAAANNFAAYHLSKTTAQSQHYSMNGLAGLTVPSIDSLHTPHSMGYSPGMCHSSFSLRFLFRFFLNSNFKSYCLEKFSGSFQDFCSC